MITICFRLSRVACLLLCLTPEVPLAVVQVLRALLPHVGVVPVVAVVLVIAVADSAITARRLGLLHSSHHP